MKPKDIFSLAIRLLGLVFLYHGLEALPVVVTTLLAGAGRSFLHSLLTAVWQFLLAVWFIRGAPLVLRGAYPDTRPPGE